MPALDLYDGMHDLCDHIRECNFASPRFDPPHPGRKGGGARMGQCFVPAPQGGARMGLVFLSPPPTNKDYNCKFSKP